MAGLKCAAYPLSHEVWHFADASRGSDIGQDKFFEFGCGDHLSLGSKDSVSFDRQLIWRCDDVHVPCEAELSRQPVDRSQQAVGDDRPTIK